MPDKNTFAHTLRALMKEQKLSQRALASQLCVSYQAVSLWCSGKNYPECDMLLKIAAYFGVSTDYLLTGIKPENQSAHNELGLSDEAIERLKFLHGDKEYDEKLMPFVNALLSDKRFYATFWECLHALITNSGAFIARFANARNIELTQFELFELERNPDFVARGLIFATQHCFYSMVDYFRKFFREHTDIENAESLYEVIKPRLYEEIKNQPRLDDEGAGDLSLKL